MDRYDIFVKLPEVLLPWYGSHKRELPWRTGREPYHVWVSEIMLQQTRVEAVKGYYTRFLNVLPTVAHLAEADDELLYKLWEGLGYYSRVRNLKKAAQIIMEQYGGVFPRDYETVLALPGVGAYTAGAICSIAFEQPVPAVDGNVLRVVSRLTDDATPIDLPAYKKQVRLALQKIYPAQAGEFTQALMELGATVCGPDKKPDCKSCPCSSFCVALRNGTVDRLPAKLPKRQRRTEEMTVFIFSCGGRYALEKRQNEGLLAALWQLPNIPGKLDTQSALAAAERLGLQTRDILRATERTHLFTHIRWDMRGVYIEVIEPAGAFVWLTPEQIREQAALPTAFRQFLEDIIGV